MARYTGPRLQALPSRKDEAVPQGQQVRVRPKCPIEIRPYPPGEHGRGRTKDSEYLLQMREKQKCARIYGVLEKQFRGYYEQAEQASTGKTGENLLRICSRRRLDNVVYRAGFAHRAPTWPASWSSTATSSSTGAKVDIPSFLVSENDIIEVREKSRELTPFVDRPGRGSASKHRAGVDRGHLRRRCASSSTRCPSRQIIDTQVQRAADRRALQQVVGLVRTRAVHRGRPGCTTSVTSNEAVVTHRRRSPCSLHSAPP